MRRTAERGRGGGPGGAELPLLPPQPGSGFERLRSPGGVDGGVKCVAEAVETTAWRGAGQPAASPQHESLGPRVPAEPRA